MADDWFEVAQQRQRLLDVQARLLNRMIDRVETLEGLCGELGACLDATVVRLRGLRREPGKEIEATLQRWRDERGN